MEKTIITTSSSAEREAALHCIDALADDPAAIAALYRFAYFVRTLSTPQPLPIRRTPHGVRGLK